MPEDADHNYFRIGEQRIPRAQKRLSQAGQKPWFTTPAPIKRLFDKFPLRTYPPNELPQRRESVSTEHILYVFATEEGAKEGRPSFNPSCLKWQV